MEISLKDRHAALLVKAMALSRQRQDVEAQRAALDQEMLKAAGAIELLESLIAEETQ
jgi:hypothetical protein